MDSLHQIATLHILRGAAMCGTTLSQEEIDKLISKIPTNVKNIPGWFFVVGRNFAIDKLCKEKSAAKRAVLQKEAELRLAKEIDDAESKAYRAVTLLRVLQDAIAIMDARAYGVIGGMKLLVADIRGDKEQYAKLCKGINPDAIYQRRHRAMESLQQMLLGSEYELLMDLCFNTQHKKDL